MSCACTGRNSISAAPNAMPQSEPRPAATAPTTRKIESVTGYVSGLTNATVIASSDPAMPA